MAEAAFKIETEWLSVYLEHYGDVFFSEDAQEYMRRNGVSIPEVLDILKKNPVVESEKQEVGALWTVIGATCNGENICVIVEVETNLIRVNVVEVERL